MSQPQKQDHSSGAEAGEPLFRIRDLSKSFGPKQILEEIDFDVHRGECLVILGGSGSGKSVTLRHLNGLETPDRGTVDFEDQRISDLDERDLVPLRKRMAMLFQGGALFDSMNVLENVAFSLREHTDLEEDEIREAVAEKLAMVKLSDIEEKMPADLSGGMKKRVALARSLVLEPEVLLFDEPTTGLDPVTSAAIGNLIRRIQKELGVTAVVVTHDIPLARRVGDRIAFLKDCHFRFLGTWDEAEASDDATLADFIAGREEEEDRDGA